MEINVTLIVQAFIFLVLLCWLSKFLFRPFLSLFEERERRIEGARREAKDMEAEVAQNIEAVEAKVLSAQKEARKVMYGIKAEGLVYQKEILDKAKEDAKALVESASNKLALDVKSLKEELHSQVPVFSSEVMASLLSSGAPCGSPSGPSGRMESRSV